MNCLLLALITFFISLETRANYYNCQEADGEPIEDIQNKSIKLEYETKSSQWLEDARSKQHHKENKIPFLLYYAIDSAEPFMQLSVHFEINQLEKNCKGSSYVNFAAILNSLYIKQNQIIICKNKEFKIINLSHVWPVCQR